MGNRGTMGRLARGGKIIPAEAFGAFTEADTILATARDRAREMVEAARYGRAEIVEQARREGIELAKSDASELLIRARAEHQKMLADMQDDVVNLALEVARKVIHRQIELTPEIVVDICSRAMNRVLSARALILRVHPDDLPVVESRYDALSLQARAGASLQLVADSEIQRGGCLIDSDCGRIDARLETQLATMERALLEDDDE